METYDVVVIGAGPGGYPAAIRAAQLGAKVAIVEKEQLGGTCLNWGCIPTKTLIASSDLYWRMGHAGSFGLRSQGQSFDFAAMQKRKDDVVTKLRGGVAQLLKGNGVTAHAGTASFLDSRHLVVRSPDGVETRLETRATIIATGSESAVPGFIPRHDRIMESRRFLERSALPARLVVLGGGVIGCEFACMAAQLGSKVTIVEMLDDILFVLDADVRRELRRHMESALGIRVMTGKPMESISADAAKVAGRVGEETVEGDVLLVSVGRKPVTRDLNLAAAGLAATKSGHLAVDAFCRTSVGAIFAIGDVTGLSQLAHAATAQGITAAENAVRKTQGKAETLVPACIFTAPEVGSVGLSEDDAKKNGVQIKVGRFALAGLGKALAAGETGGFVKWVVDARTDRLLGAHAIGAHATELISEATAAIRAELTSAELGKTIHCHPTFSESWMEAAHAVHGECIHAPPKRKPQA
jgi:dihydrolipoamide dehydrogenase